MSLPLKNELRLRLGPQHCGAEVWSGGLFPRRAGEASRAGRAGAPIDALLDEMFDALARGGLALPRHASICAEDEYVYYATLPGLGSWKAAHAAACNYFADMLGDDEVLVDTTLAPCGSRWIAAAIDAVQVSAWRDALEARGIDLRSVRPALLEDLWSLRPHITLRDGLLVLVRSEGASMIGLRGNAVSEIAWERCDVADGVTLGERIDTALLDRCTADEAPSPVSVCLVPQHAEPLPALRELAQRRGWQLSESLLQQAG